MPRRCTVCDHPKRAEIDLACVGSTVAFRNIGQQYELGFTSVFHHAKDHIPALLAEAREAEVVAEADTLLERVEGLGRKAEYWHTEAVSLVEATKVTALDDDDEKPRGTFLDRANAIRVGTQAVREIGRVLELLGKVTGELREREVVVNVLIAGQPTPTPAAELVAVIQALLGAVAAFPDAAAAVDAAIAAKLEAPPPRLR